MISDREFIPKGDPTMLKRAIARSTSPKEPPMTSKLDPQELGKITPELIDEFVPALKGYAASAGTEGFAVNAACLMLETIADKLRTGQLVPAMPSGDVVEAVALALFKLALSRMPDEPPQGLAPIWQDWIDDATAAITAYEAVSGVAKMRDALEDLRATPYPPVEDPDDTLGSMLDNQAWIVLSHVASRIGQRDGIEFMERWQDAWAEGEVQKGYFSPHRGVAAWIARHCQLTPEARAALGEKP